MSSEIEFKLQHSHSQWKHSHNFAFGHETESERRTFWVMVLTALMTVAEISAGWFYKSIALFADGWHMSTHAVALGIGYFAYRYARVHAKDHDYTFGTGKVHALGSYSSALILACVALFVFFDSIWAFFLAEAISYSQALPVAFVGLVVNLLSIRLLHVGQGHSHGDGHGHEHDHNLKAAYAHVVVDAMTSVLAILALLAGKYLHWYFMDPLVGVIGAVIIAQWSFALIKSALKLLLDKQPSSALLKEINDKIISDGDSQIADLHLWHVAPGRLAAIVSVVTHEQRPVEEYRGRLSSLGLSHLTIELNNCPR
jgi:cation diffusion facilitator family transporter